MPPHICEMIESWTLSMKRMFLLHWQSRTPHTTSYYMTKARDLSCHANKEGTSDTICKLQKSGFPWALLAVIKTRFCQVLHRNWNAQVTLISPCPAKGLAILLRLVLMSPGWPKRWDWPDTCRCLMAPRSRRRWKRAL